MDNPNNSAESKKKFIPKWNTADPYLYSLVKDKRKQMRDDMTNAESVLWEFIKSKKLGVKFRRQHIIANFIPDFVCLSCKLIIEVDGEIHNFHKEYDRDRTSLLNKDGYRVIRFKNEEVLYNIEYVIQKIKENINQSNKD